MPLLEKYIEDTYSWAVWKVEESCEELQKFFDKDYTEELQKFSLESRRKDFLVARLLIKLLTGKEIEIYYESSGKPIICDNHFQVSISHTKSYVAVITHTTQAVGIDIERISPRILKIKNRFLSETELTQIDKKNEIIYLLLCWSAKESMFKVLGETDVIFSDHLHLAPFSIQEDLCIKSFESRTLARKKFNIYYKIFDDFVLTMIFGENISEYKLNRK